MLKKVLTTTVLAASALTVMAANAAAPGPYVTGQLGYANTHMKGKTNLDELKAQGVQLDGNNLSNNGLAGRLAVGYQFNQNWAVEMGYLQLGSKKVNGSLDLQAHGIPTKVNGSLNLNQNAIDLVAKGILPLANNLNLYGKLGVAYLRTNIDAKAEIKDDDISVPITVGINDLGGIAKHKWAPEAAIGVSYDITPNVSIDTSWTHIQPLGKNRPGNIDFVAVGVGYSFG